MTLLFIRLFFLIITSFVGYFIGGFSEQGVLGAFWGAAAATGLIVLEAMLKRVSVRGLSSMVFGLLLGVFMAKLVADVITLLPLSEQMHSITRVILTLIFSYLGAVMALRGKDEFHLIIPYVRLRRKNVGERITLLDTSAVIDGRIVEIYRTHFFDDRLVVANCVLEELQALADSSDSVKRQKGRRGLDIARKMQENAAVDVRIHEDSFMEKEVDSRLVRLAKMIDARICTMDHGLEQVAKIQGVEVLNINTLAAAVRPVFTVGDEIFLVLERGGTESGQAVGYTADGTMVVVASAKEQIGQEVCVVVTSLLQTSSGKMIFANLKEGL